MYENFMHPSVGYGPGDDEPLLDRYFTGAYGHFGVQWDQQPPGTPALIT